MNMVVQKEHLQVATMILHQRSCGDMRGSHKLFLACSNRPNSDDDPFIPRSSGGEVCSGKRSLGISIAERSNDVTSSPSPRLGQKIRSLVQQSMGNGCFARAASVMDPGKSNALIADPIRDVEAFERSKRDKGSSGPPTQHLGLPTIPSKGCNRMKMRNPHKKAHNVVRLDKVLNRMRTCILKAQLKFKKRRLDSYKKTMSKALPPLNSIDFSKENPQGSLGSKNKGKKNHSLIGDGAAGDSLSDGNIVNMNRIIVQSHDKLGIAEIWDIGKQLGLSYLGDDAEIIQRIQILEDQDKNTTAQNVAPRGECGNRSQ
ncbi:hypothetical protein Ancab_010168 [Ancistrocladus abbreviatus]